MADWELACEGPLLVLVVEVKGRETRGHPLDQHGLTISAICSAQTMHVQSTVVVYYMEHL